MKIIQLYNKINKHYLLYISKFKKFYKNNKVKIFNQILYIFVFIIIIIYYNYTLLYYNI